MEFKVFENKNASSIEMLINELNKTHDIHNIWTSATTNWYLIIVSCIKR